jgi:serpin B
VLRRTVLTAPLALGLSACASGTEAAPTPADAAPSPPNGAPVANTGHEFDVALYRQIASRPGNHFVSPYSLTAAFALVYPGARATTASEIAAVLGLNSDQSAATASSAALAHRLASETGGTQLDLANAAWVERTWELRRDYADTISDALGATIEQVDFINDQVAALARINAWAAAATQNRIPTILSEPDPDRRLVLTNAVYFKGDWTTPFLARDTQARPFHAPGGDITAPLMRQIMSKRYFETETFQAAEFDYDQGAFALDVFLPRERSSLAAFERDLTGAALDAWLTQLGEAEQARLDVMLPKLELRADYGGLGDTLQDMGMREAFSNGADFSGITARADQALKISAVIQKTYLNIDEKGTEAAAVTAIDMVAITSARIGPPPPPPIPFYCDRPFFLALRHKPTNALLFLGRITTVAPD